MGNIASTDTGKLYTLQLASIPANIAELENFLELLLEEHEVSNELYGNIMTSMNEAVINAIVHGNHCDPSKIVYVNVEVQNHRRFIFTVADEGPGFDHRNIADPTEPDNLLKDEGRGVYIMLHLADQVTYNNKGTEVELIFKG